MKIYTKRGDCCKTTLLGGKTVTKNHIRLEAYGTIDELIAHLGLLHDYSEWDDIKQWIINIQDKLMICAAKIATDASTDISLPCIKEEDVIWLETTIDSMEENLEPLNHFILPNGFIPASQSHVCRTVCRRAERKIVEVYQYEKFDEVILKYINRLSDFLFVLARFMIKRKELKEILWKPERC